MAQVSGALSLDMTKIVEAMGAEAAKIVMPALAQILDRIITLETKIDGPNSATLSDQDTAEAAKAEADARLAQATQDGPDDSWFERDED